MLTHSRGISEFRDAGLDMHNAIHTSHLTAASGGDGRFQIVVQQLVKTASMAVGLAPLVEGIRLDPFGMDTHEGISLTSPGPVMRACMALANTTLLRSPDGPRPGPRPRPSPGKVKLERKDRRVNNASEISGWNWGNGRMTFPAGATE